MAASQKKPSGDLEIWLATLTPKQRASIPSGVPPEREKLATKSLAPGDESKIVERVTKKRRPGWEPPKGWSKALLVDGTRGTLSPDTVEPGIALSHAERTAAKRLATGFARAAAQDFPVRPTLRAAIRDAWASRTGFEIEEAWIYFLVARLHGWAWAAAETKAGTTVDAPPDILPGVRDDLQREGFDATTMIPKWLTPKIVGWLAAHYSLGRGGGAKKNKTKFSKSKIVELLRDPPTLREQVARNSTP